jgi:quercetin dioxygenase-like cupin family protein
VRVVQPVEVVRLWHSAGGSIGDLLVGSDERDHIELWHWTMAPGDGRDSDAHAAGTREMVHVLAGTLTLAVDKVDHVVPTGGAALFQADHHHAYRNDGDDAVDLVMVVVQPDADFDEWVAEISTDNTDNTDNTDSEASGES